MLYIILKIDILLAAGVNLFDQCSAKFVDLLSKIVCTDSDCYTGKERGVVYADYSSIGSQKCPQRAEVVV